MPSWDPNQYLRFDQSRLRPALDLIAAVPLAEPAEIYDLGCGPGNVTLRLADRWPGAHITGIDSSPDMLRRAREVSEDQPRIDWQEADVSTWSPRAPADLLFSNACLHWLDQHEQLFPGLMDGLASGGALAVQMPTNFTTEPSHLCIVEAVETSLHRHRLLAALRPNPVSNAAAYYDWLAPHSERVDIWETTYLHVLDGENAVAEWTKGTALRPLLDALPDEAARAEFFADYSRLVSAAYPRRADGRTLFPFRRLFIVAVKA